MERVTVDLDETLQEFVEQKVGHGGFRSAADVVIEALRDAQARDAKAKLESLLGESLNARPLTDVDQEYWVRKRERLELASSN